LLLNGRTLNVRGVGLQEDSRSLGFAITNQIRDQQIAWTRELGATLLRAHYPLHPYTLEQADRLGLLVWSEIPVWQVDTEELARREVRDAAVNVLRRHVEDARNHPSVLLWSIGNELSARPGPVQASYIRGAAGAAKELDPTRPVALAVAASPTVGCQAEYGPLDVIGLNDYFGWYPGTNGVIADRELLSEYLDSVRACYPEKALVMSEFGAEANRSGPLEERGTYEFQNDFIAYHLGVYATKPWLSGAIWWALQEFRVRPGWDGGNPRPIPPIHQKGVVGFDGARKPGFAELQRLFRGASQIAPAPAS
jgi:beta-glucuronidase